MVPHLAKSGVNLAKYLDTKVGQDLEARDVFGMYAMDALATAGFGIETNSFEEPENIFRMMAMRMAGAPGFTSSWD